MAFIHKGRSHAQITHNETHTLLCCPNDLILFAQHFTVPTLQFSDQMFFKDMLLKKSELEELGNEPRAVIDFLVLRRASSLVGFAPSTFSRYLGEYRQRDGIAQGSTVMVDKEPGRGSNMRLWFGF
jgi:hypothetical protein